MPKSFYKELASNIWLPMLISATNGLPVVHQLNFWACVFMWLTYYVTLSIRRELDILANKELSTKIQEDQASYSKLIVNLGTAICDLKEEVHQKSLIIERLQKY